MQNYKIMIEGLSKAFQGRKVLDGLDMELASGNTYCLMGASGIGKTTFLRILLGLEEADEGSVLVQAGTCDGGSSPICSSPVYSSLPAAAPGNLRLVAVFQEDRLCETFSALENVMLAAGKSLKRADAYAQMCRLLPEESILRPVSTLSGGMKRRVSILRALLAPSCGILMDEPFTGLDEKTRQVVIDYMKEQAAGKLLVVVTHQEEDAAALGGRLITLR